MAKPIGTLGTIPTVSIGGTVFTDLTNLIVLTGFVGSGANSNASLRLPNGSSGYTVTSGKTYTIQAVKASTLNSTGALVLLLYSDNDVGLGSSTAFTNPVYDGGSNANYGMVIGNTGSGSNSIFESGGLFFKVPQTKFPGTLCSFATYLRYYGYET